MSLLALCETEADIDRLLAKCMYSTKVCALTFWPETFDSAFCEAHDKLFSLVDSREPRHKEAIVGGRGVGKTTILRACVARLVLFRLKRYIVYISQSEEAAIESTEEIKRMLISNEYIKRMEEFGNMKKRPDINDVEDSFSKKSWVAHWPGDGGQFPIKVLPRGAGQQVRGRLFQHYRPDFLVLDDLEDKETVTNDTIRDKNYKYVISDVVRAVSRTKHDWQIVYIDTLKHEDSVMARLLNSKTWQHHYMPICDSQYKTLMDPFIPQSMIDIEVAAAREDGDLDEFAREYMCLSISTEAAKFKRSYFQYYNEDEPLAQGEHPLSKQSAIQSIITCDPAKTTGDKSCKSALVVWGIDQANRRFYLRFIDKGRYHPSELIDRYLDYCLRFNCVAGGVEVTGLEEFIKWPLQQAMIERNIYTPIIWCKARGKKESRAGMLETIYRRGQVWHNREIAHLIEMSLLSYPRPAEWDVLDAAAYLFEVMEQGKAYLTGGGVTADSDDADAFAALDREQLDDFDDDFDMDFNQQGVDDRWMYDRTLSSKRQFRVPRAFRLRNKALS